jgi:hypothetical protein
MEAEALIKASVRPPAEAVAAAIESSQTRDERYEWEKQQKENATFSREFMAENHVGRMDDYEFESWVADRFFERGGKEVSFTYKEEQRHWITVQRLAVGMVLGAIVGALGFWFKHKFGVILPNTLAFQCAYGALLVGLVTTFIVPRLRL